MFSRFIGLVVVIGFVLGLASTCFGVGAAPVAGVYVYGPPTAGHSTSVYPYPKNWRGPRYAYPQTYYFKFPPGRRPVHIGATAFSGAGITALGATAVADPLFFHGATTDAEIWAVRRKGEVSNLPAAARLNLPARTRLVPTIGPLPKRPLSPYSADGTRPLIEYRRVE